MDKHQSATESPLVTPLSRRMAMAAAVTGIGVVAFGAPSIRAQGATPVATPALTNGKTAFLFVQSGFTAGSLEPNGDGTFQLTLASAPEQTIYFSDRPDRLVGTAPTARVLEVLGFDPADPPNAALVIAQADGSTDTVMLELIDPVYDAKAATLSYKAKVLERYGTLEATGVGFVEQPLTATQVPATFGGSSLFIDSLLGCSPWDPRC